MWLYCLCCGDKNNRLLSENKGGVVTNYTYDKNGNTLTSGGTTYTYDARDRQITHTKSSVTTSYTYNPSGLRRTKTSNGSTRYFVWSGMNLVYEYNAGSTGTAYHYGINRTHSSGGTYYMYNGHCDGNHHGIVNMDDDILERSESTKNKTIRFRWQHALIAALLSVCLMGAGLVAVIWGDSIQSCFGHYWQAIIGQEMSSGHSALIDHLSQEIGVSQTIGDVTVTVDSATVGDDGFYLLFRIEGMHFAGRKIYGFNNTEIHISPDPTKENGGMTSYGYDSHGIDGDGSVILIMKYDYVTKIRYVEDTQPLEVEITLRDLVESPQTEW